ncbi:MAG: BatA domain-containing protein, partial [Planctomycetota bacterium]|nr:BatA domain-containing protein [Planctomycetota bacterium]
MSFLQAWMLWGLPFIALPIAIHLIHKRRQRVVEWGAMMFLLQGAKMSKGMQRLRQLLLLTVRTLAVIGLIIGLGRPIAGGWLGGFGGGRPDVVLVLLDRSASMTEEVAGGRTKLAAGVERIAAALESVHATRLVVIDSVGLVVTELEAPSDLIDLPLAGETATRADVPAMFEVAAEHLRANSSGRAEIWICSDGQTSDWNPEDGRWPALQDKLIALPAG